MTRAARRSRAPDLPIDVVVDVPAIGSHPPVALVVLRRPVLDGRSPALEQPDVGVEQLPEAIRQDDHVDLVDVEDKLTGATAGSGNRVEAGVASGGLVIGDRNPAAVM